MGMVVEYGVVSGGSLFVGKVSSWGGGRVALVDMARRWRKEDTRDSDKSC